MSKGFKSELKENSIARTLQIIGWLELVAALVVMIFSNGDDIFGIDFEIVVWVSAFIISCIFQGFAEIIELLYKNGKKKDAIYELLKERLSTNGETTKSVIEDIEANLPKM